jgi:hypothetical protein
MQGVPGSWWGYVASGWTAPMNSRPGTFFRILHYVILRTGPLLTSRGTVHAHGIMGRRAQMGEERSYTLPLGELVHTAPLPQPPP